MAKDKSEKKEHKKKKEAKENGDVAPDGDVSMAITEPDDVDERVSLHFSSLFARSTVLNQGHIFFDKPSKKAKKEKDEIVVNVEDLIPIAKPLAQKKLLKKLHKTIKKGIERLYIAMKILA